MEKFNGRYVLFLALVSAMGGFLFGYDWVVIGGAKPFYEQFFDIGENPTLQGWAMSSALIGCMIGAVCSGPLADTWGRKRPLQIAATLFIVSALGTGFADSFFSFIAYRLLGGVGIGLASTLSPLYIAEIAPAKVRGRFVSINQLTIVIGILTAQLTNWLVAESIPENVTAHEMLASWNVQMGWRVMFWMELIPAVIFFLLMFLIPESPRYLAKIGAYRKSSEILNHIGGSTYAQNELRNIKMSFREVVAKNMSFSQFHGRGLLPILTVGIVLAIFQQWCGINIIFNYAQEIFISAGYSVGDMLFNIVITGSVNLAFTVVAMRTVDSWGRRQLMLFGALGLSIIYALLGGAYFLEFSGWPVLVLVVAAIAIYAMSLAPVTWVVLSEIFPNQIRGLAMSIATFSLWVASFVLTFTFPILNKTLGPYGTFWIYSMICLCGFLFIYLKLPETKGKSLEEIENEISNETY